MGEGGKRALKLFSFALKKYIIEFLFQQMSKSPYGIDSSYQISKCSSKCSHTTNGHQCVSHSCLCIRDMKKIHKAILRKRIHIHKVIIGYK